jgi:excisionase family DNA binding protein
MAEKIELKRTPMPGVAQTQTQRYGLLGAALLKRQTEFTDLYAERYLTAREAAGALQISIPTLRRFAHQGMLPHVRLGGARGWMRFKASTIRNFLEKGTV